MRDDIDRAQREVDRLQHEALRQRKPEGPKATDRCLNPACGELLPPGQRWCDSGCTAEWQRRTKRH